MKAKLEFNLPEEEMEFKQCVKARDLCFSIFELRERLFRLSKQYESVTMEEIFVVLNDVLESNNVNIDELIE